MEGPGLSSAQFLGPVTGDRILVCLKWWSDHYKEKYPKRFPYPVTKSRNVLESKGHSDTWGHFAQLVGDYDL